MATSAVLALPFSLRYIDASLRLVMQTNNARRLVQAVASGVTRLAAIFTRIGPVITDHSFFKALSRAVGYLRKYITLLAVNVLPSMTTAMLNRPN